MSADVIPDQVVCFKQGEFQCFVGGRLHGAWTDRETAEMGMRVEQRRLEARKAKGELA